MDLPIGEGAKFALLLLRIHFRFRGIADMALLAAGSTRSRMTRNGPRKACRPKCIDDPIDATLVVQAFVPERRIATSTGLAATVGNICASTGRDIGGAGHNPRN
jgi:hypothetical protein